MSGLRAGVSSINITPPIGVDLTGFGGRESPAIGIHDDLFAKCLALDDGSQKAAIVTMDLLGLDRDIVDIVREDARSRFGLDPQSIMLSASHTHSGPATISLRGMGDRDETYISELTRKLSSAIKMALDNMKPARVGFGFDAVRIGVNRRQKTGDGRMILGKNPQGPMPEGVKVIRIDGEDGTPRAVFFSLATHPVTLGGNNLLISADYPGSAMRLVEETEGCVAMFAQGCCGDINSERVGATFDFARRLGRILGGHTIGTLESITTGDEAEIRSLSRLIELPLQEPLPLEEARKLVRSHEEQLARAMEANEHEGRLKLHRGMLEWARDMEKLSATGRKDFTQWFEIQAIQITKECVILGMSGEVFVDYQLELEKRSPYAFSVILGYTNGCIGYVPTAAAYPDGGYEVDRAYQYYGTLMLKPESESIVKQACMDILNELREGE